MRWIIGALCLALALVASLNGSSLWTDEAFSAWLAGHHSFTGLLHSLATGDSSDLQMGLYYVYLFAWARVFGIGEFALRAANIPFILIFKLAVVWASTRVFKSRIAWLAGGAFPFVWQYAAEARPYQAILAFSAVALAALLGFLELDPSKSKKLPWLCLACIFVGSLFHMLLLLVVLPLAVLAAFPGNSQGAKWRQWIVPLATFAAPLLGLGIFFLWTFHRPAIAYDYPRPNLKSMGSVFYELAGLSGFGPNRKFSIDFRPYAVPAALGAIAVFGGAVAAFVAGLRKPSDSRLISLTVAVCVACVEAMALSVLTGKQFDARHLAALVPVCLYLLMGILARGGRLPLLAMVLLGGAWLIADIRTAVLPEYQKEDYRDAVAAAIRVQMQVGAEIVLASDPVAPAYYGLDVLGRAPCYPFAQGCSQALRQATWPQSISALDAAQWNRSEILLWLEREKLTARPVVVLVQLDRSHRSSPWWPILAESTGASRTRVHGFEIVLLPGSRP